ncbi:MAG: aminoacetone oxidase family FAD-binding enzyme, partial [Clostridia bacterium]|nr:aminoacetone oxidase family FAD-binding enzyme [Clostridia bacterium]
MFDSNMIQKRVAVIGGGAAGMMAAIHAAYMGAEVTLYEKNDRLGKKLRITGKGRCNVTNDSTTEEFLQNVPTNPRFLYAALNRFGTQDTVDFFEGCGVPLKVERGKRVFPVSDKASDIVRALTDRMKDCGVKTVTDKITDIEIVEGAVRGVLTGNNKYPADAVIVCTGGRSYSMTGSDGDGYKFARRAGHTVTELKPSLVPIVCEGNLCRRMQGLSLKNVAMKIVRKDNGRCVYEDFGEMMFTHFGITGPMVLSASAHLPDITDKIYEAHIDLKPALDEAA